MRAPALLCSVVGAGVQYLALVEVVDDLAVEALLHLSLGVHALEALCLGREGLVRPLPARNTQNKAVKGFC